MKYDDSDDRYLRFTRVVIGLLVGWLIGWLIGWLLWG